MNLKDSALGFVTFLGFLDLNEYQFVTFWLDVLRNWCRLL